MRKALSTPAIHFKGSGWAKKDAAASAKKAKAPAGVIGHVDRPTSKAPADSPSQGVGNKKTASGSAETSVGSCRRHRLQTPRPTSRGS